METVSKSHAPPTQALHWTLHRVSGLKIIPFYTSGTGQIETKMIESSLPLPYSCSSLVSSHQCRQGNPGSMGKRGIQPDVSNLLSNLRY